MTSLTRDGSKSEYYATLKRCSTEELFLRAIKGLNTLLKSGRLTTCRDNSTGITRVIYEDSKGGGKKDVLGLKLIPYPTLHKSEFQAGMSSHAKQQRSSRFRGSRRGVIGEARHVMSEAAAHYRRHGTGRFFYHDSTSAITITFNRVSPDITWTDKGSLGENEFKEACYLAFLGLGVTALDAKRIPLYTRKELESQYTSFRISSNNSVGT
ncbi:hypothetical protein TRVA0_041S01310 [Trichomonascus vanleenenianus]|uniref:uncharacterized protein n=1 Tax=Trichomonascus vanleenenianus TaxID=2268995 RepID=UPI003ECAA1B8